jgi:enamine deaminase RidA (YjgF/YER057c/UK114 family)
MSAVEARLRALGLTLPEPKAPVANYLGTKRSGDLLFVSGRVSQRRGEVGSEIALADARMAARDVALDLLAIIKLDIGDLDRIASIEELFGESGRHARTATGAAQLPFGAAVQLDMVVRLSPE